MNVKSTRYVVVPQGYQRFWKSGHLETEFAHRDRPTNGSDCGSFLTQS